MKHEIGDRVGAMSHSDADTSTAYLFGYGVYQGELIPDPSLKVQFFGMPMDFPNPCLMLDSGKQIFGCECWWGGEEEVKKQVEKFSNVLLLDIEQERQKSRAE
jgi:hypothetical protein